MAARGARAAAGRAGDRVPEQCVPRPGRGSGARLSPGPERNRLYRRSEYRHPISLGGGATRSVAGAGGRSGPSASRRIAQAGHVLGVFAAKAATTAIPIVFVTGVDPVALGLVASLNRPGANLTGVTTMGIELEPKRLELLHGLIPAATTVGALVNRMHPIAEVQSSELQAAARALGLKLQILDASTERDFDAVFAKLVELQAGGLVI